MKKVVLKLDFADEKIKQKAMKRVSGVSGLESIALDPKDKKLTVTGDIDPVALVAKLRKLCHTEIVSVGPAKEPEKKKEEPQKVLPKMQVVKVQTKEDHAAQLRNANEAYNQQLQHQYYYQQHHHQYKPYPQPAVAPPSYYNRSVEEDPNACVIC